MTHTYENTLTIYEEVEDTIKGKKSKRIYFKGITLTADGRSTFLHEGTHIWQHQHAIFFFTGVKGVQFTLELWYRTYKAKKDSDPDTDTETVVAYMYDWRRSADKTPPVPFGKLNREQQAQVVRDYFQGSYEAKYKKYVEDAIEQVRAKKAK